VPTPKFSAAIQNLLRAAELCLGEKLTLPCLIILYSGIDMVSALDRRVNETVGAGFVRWCESYLLRARPMACNGLDLWSARCGVLHTGTPDSNLTRSGQARRLLYAWGTKRPETLQALVDALGHTNEVSVHIGDIADGLRDGMALYFADLQQDGSRAAVAAARAAEILLELDPALVERG
jgi:hypothetical protein